MSRDQSGQGDSIRAAGAAHPAVAAFIDVLDALVLAAADMQDAGVEQMRQQCRQLLDQIDASALSDEAFDWDAARQQAVALVNRERDFAVSRFDDFRQMIWVVIQGLREAFRDEQSADNEVVQHLTRLHSVIDSDSIDELRSEVVAAIMLINRAIEERKKRQRAQLEELGTQLNRMRNELLKAQRELALDPMTRLYNRASFDELLEKTIELSLFSGQASCLLMIDIDHFKSINDGHGHVVGDQVVLQVAKCLKKTFPRKSDFVARYGGDEFAVVLQDTEARDGEMLAKRALADIKAVSVTTAEGVVIAPSLSIGVSALRKSDNPHAWLSRSDQALYQAKRAGRGCVWLAKGEE